MALASADFLAAIGVDTHVDGTDTPYENAGAVAENLKYIGVSLTRDHAYDTAFTAFDTLAAAGIKFDFVTDANLAEEVATFAPLAASIRYFEGATEVNYWPVPVPGLSGAAADLFS